MDEEAGGIHEEGDGMNARQKAKRLKKIAALYKAEADAWRQLANNWERCAKNEATMRHEIQARVKTIHFFKLVTHKELEYVPEDVIKRELATEIGQALLDANLIRWKTEDVPKMCCKRYAAIIEALTQEDKK